MAEGDIDLDRAIDDPIYRRKVIEQLNREKPKTPAPEHSVEGKIRPPPVDPAE